MISIFDNAEHVMYALLFIDNKWTNFNLDCPRISTPFTQYPLFFSNFRIAEFSTEEMSDEESFVILGSSPTPSMEQYNGDNTSMMTKPNALQNGSLISENMMQSSTQTIQNFSLLNPSSLSLSAHSENANLKNDSLVKSLENNDDMQVTNEVVSSASGVDFAEKFLMGEIPADSLKVSNKHFNLKKRKRCVCVSTHRNFGTQVKCLFKISIVTTQITSGEILFAHIAWDIFYLEGI